MKQDETAVPKGKMGWMVQHWIAFQQNKFTGAALDCIVFSRPPFAKARPRVSAVQLLPHTALLSVEPAHFSSPDAMPAAGNSMPRTAVCRGKPRVGDSALSVGFGWLQKRRNPQVPRAEVCPPGFPPGK